MNNLDVVPLGGLGEFGMNLMAISHGDTSLVIDAGERWETAAEFAYAAILTALGQTR